jgi:hypothetical protein
MLCIWDMVERWCGCEACRGCLGVGVAGGENWRVESWVVLLGVGVIGSQVVLMMLVAGQHVAQIQAGRQLTSMWKLTSALL